LVSSSHHEDYYYAVFSSIFLFPLPRTKYHPHHTISNNFSLRYFLNMLGLDSHPYNKQDKVTIPYVVMFISLENKRKDNPN